LARGITELDDSDAYESLVQRLTASYRPVGDLEIFWVRRIAFGMVRLDRAARLEAEYITAEIHPSVRDQVLPALECPTIEPEFSATVGSVGAINLVSGFQRYETAIENKLCRAINQLERLQRTRRGEFVPAPEALDVSVHSGGERETPGWERNPRATNCGTGYNFRVIASFRSSKFI